MRTFVKCEICNAEIPVDKCPFATHKKVIEGKEYVFCCSIMQRKFMFDQTAIDCEEDSKRVGARSKK